MKDEFEAYGKQERVFGWQEGRQEGRREGWREGRQSEQNDTAERLMRMQMSSDVIMAATRLSLDQLEELSRSLNIPLKHSEKS